MEPFRKKNPPQKWRQWSAMIATEIRLGTRGENRAVVAQVPSMKLAVYISTVFDRRVKNSQRYLHKSILKTERYRHVDLPAPHTRLACALSIKTRWNQPRWLLRVRESPLHGWPVSIGASLPERQSLSWEWMSGGGNHSWNTITASGSFGKRVQRMHHADEGAVWSCWVHLRFDSRSESCDLMAKWDVCPFAAEQRNHTIRWRSNRVIVGCSLGKPSNQGFGGQFIDQKYQPRRSVDTAHSRFSCQIMTMILTNPLCLLMASLQF